jgi:hypothetical protein
MKIRTIARQFETIHDFRIQNLIVGGCSFTYNNHETAACTWPYYLRDLGGFEQVYDFSMVGGGNTHTRNAMIYGLEKQPIDPATSLVIVQWAGNDRDDYIIDPAAVNDFPFTYFYEKDAMVGITGGQDIANLKDPGPIRSISSLKNKTCRSIENFVNILSLKTYLTCLGYESVFFEYRNYTLPGRDNNFDPRLYLPEEIANRYDDLMDVMPKNFQKFCLYHNMMEQDDFHPSIHGHLKWTRESLIPYLINHYQ